MENINLKNIYDENVQIKIVDSEKEANFITHSGTFHADEIMASVILLNKFGDMNIYRTNKVTKEWDELENYEHFLDTNKPYEIIE